MIINQKILMLKKKVNNESYYDLIDDFILIEASFASEYNIRLKVVDNLSSDEFFHLLAGLTEESALGKIVSIRSEQNPDIIKKYNKFQRKIYDDWQDRINKIKNKGLSEKEVALKIENQILKLLR